MSPQRPDTEKQSHAESRRRSRKPTLMQSYSAAFDDDNLQQIVSQIRGITDGPPQHKTLPKEAAPSTQAPKPKDHSVGHAVDQPGDQSPGQSADESTTRSDDRPIESPQKRSNVRPIRSPNVWSNERPHEESADAAASKVVTLNENQAILYVCIYWLQGQTTSLQQIGHVTGISPYTLKHCLHKLRQEAAILYYGRQNTAGRIGFVADAVPCSIQLRGDEHQLRRRLADIQYERLAIVRPIEVKSGASDGAIDLMGDLLNGPMNQLMRGPMDEPDNESCSSSKQELLQGLVLDGVFKNLNPMSLAPYLNAVQDGEALQDFLDMANACVAAARGTETPIRNPKGFLIAQLKAGFINPPDGYKSRRVKAQEQRNQKLREELEELQRLRNEEEELELEVFRARLSKQERERLVTEARNRLDPRGMFSEARQLEMAEFQILREWFEARRGSSLG